VTGWVHTSTSEPPFRQRFDSSHWLSTAQPYLRRNGK
jgi:hypothetical protein